MRFSSLPICLFLILLPMLVMSELNFETLVAYRGSILLISIIWICCVTALSAITERWPTIRGFSTHWFTLLIAAFFVLAVERSKILLEDEQRGFMILFLLSASLLFRSKLRALHPLGLVLVAGLGLIISLGSFYLFLEKIPWQAGLLAVGASILLFQNEVRLDLPKATESRTPNIPFLRFHSMLWGIFPVAFLVLFALKDIERIYLLPLISLILCNRVLHSLRTLEYQNTLPDAYRRNALQVIWMQMTLVILARIILTLWR